MSDQTPKLALPFIQAGQAQKHVTHNEALERLDALVQLSVQRIGSTTPPNSAPEGHAWGIGDGATDAWAGRAGQIAHWHGGGWIFSTPQDGWRIWDRNAGALRVWLDGAWTDLPAPVPDLDNLDGVGVGTASDATNRLAVAADATLLTHAGAGHQVKINKADSTDTASLLYQSNWQGRAEMGLAGSDDFSVKVSPDGSTFTESMTIDTNSGAVRFPAGLAGSGSPAGVLGLQSMAFTSERKSVFLVGNYLAFGNGATEIAGAVMPFAGRVVAVTLSQYQPVPGLNGVQMTVNRVASPAHGVTLTATGAEVEAGFADLSASPLPFVAGDALALQVSNSTNGNNTSVGTFFVVFD